MCLKFQWFYSYNPRLRQRAPEAFKLFFANFSDSDLQTCHYYKCSSRKIERETFPKFSVYMCSRNTKFDRAFQCCTIKSRFWHTLLENHSVCILLVQYIYTLHVDSIKITHPLSFTIPNCSVATTVGTERYCGNSTLNLYT